MSFFNEISGKTTLSQQGVGGKLHFGCSCPLHRYGLQQQQWQFRLGVAFELGVLLYQGAPDVSNLRVNAPIDVNGFSQVEQFLADQKAEIEDDHLTTGRKHDVVIPPWQWPQPGNSESGIDRPL
jgi:hypothetical protein